MQGWVINLSEDRFPDIETRLEERQQPAVFFLDGVPVWEAWYYSPGLACWFVMSELDPASHPPAHVVFYRSAEDLREKVQRLRAARSERCSS